VRGGVSVAVAISGTHGGHKTEQKYYFTNHLSDERTVNKKNYGRKINRP
jgi:hypothetical protein